MNDIELQGWRFQIITKSGEPEGDVPYRFIGRCLDRVRWLNLMCGENRYTIKPIRVHTL